ncbi:IclR family transcriptional regulator [Sphingomonas lenta]|uniref:IclR family transcriptional regulator n=1 Tax=Sphingomonas lenta TaxID=1141887 RepID=A0A2A2SB64_9SPHN|nr:IclR family transcriptional regulator [Sphingomonas lenta]PAX06422.1 IclR family transcriptional regulator [Sphingomonas lenta]
MRRPETYSAPALEKGLAILELLAEEAEPMSMVAVARRLGRSHNEIYRMLLVLERRGYLKREADDRLRLSDRLFDLAMRNPKRRNLHDAAMPVMHRLAEQLWQSCHLAVISGADIAVVARVESPDMAGFAVRVGYRRPMVASTSGRLLFANQPARIRATLETVVAGSHPEPASFRELLEQADEIVARGYLARESSAVTSVTDIAAPVFNRQAEGAAASLTVPFVSGPSTRVPLRHSIEIVRQAAAEITRELGRT